MRGTALLQLGSKRTPSSTDTQSISLDEWQAYCREVREAAQQLHALAGRAEAVAANAIADRRDPGRAIAREIGLTTGAPASANAHSYAMMLLGPFAALEALRRRIRPD